MCAGALASNALCCARTDSKILVQAYAGCRREDSLVTLRPQICVRAVPALPGEPCAGVCQGWQEPKPARRGWTKSGVRKTVRNVNLRRRHACTPNFDFRKPTRARLDDQATLHVPASFRAISDDYCTSSARMPLGLCVDEWVSSLIPSNSSKVRHARTLASKWHSNPPAVR